MTDINNWNDQIEKKLLEWHNKCKTYSWAHVVTKDNYEDLFTYTIIPVICMGIFCSVFSTLAAIYTTKPIYAIVSAICGALSSGLSFWIQNKNPTEIAADHEKLSQGYNSVALAIETELTQSRADRIDGSRFLNNISSRMNNLVEGGPVISDDIWKDITDKYEKSKATINPDVLTSVTTDAKNRTDVPNFEFRMDDRDAVSPDVVNRMTDLQLDRRYAHGSPTGTHVL
jgi:hypothetical protein